MDGNDSHRLDGFGWMLPQVACGPVEKIDF